MPKQLRAKLETVKKLYDQQKYMYDNHTHSVSDRIVSVSQPWLRPIVRGKSKAPVEFGAKLAPRARRSGFAPFPFRLAKNLA